jgi:hypothetical protein
MGRKGAAGAVCGVCGMGGAGGSKVGQSPVGGGRGQARGRH